MGQYGKCLYLDSDIVLNRDVGELFDYDISDKLLGAVKENWQHKDFLRERAKFTPYVKDFFNAGVLLINIAKFIDNEIFPRFMELAMSGVEYPTWDQDILNILCSGKIRLLPMTWNCMWQFYSREGYKYADRQTCAEFMTCFEKPALVHYDSSLKPWLADDGHFSAMFWHYARLSPWYDRLVAECPYPLEPV